MIEKSVLMIVTYDPQSMPNQPFFHVVKYFAQNFREVHYVTRTNLYGGPRTSLSHKVGKSVRNLLYDRTRVSQEGNVKHIVTRSLKLPHNLQLMFSDLWLGANLPRWLKERHYDICVYCCPHNALLATWLRRSDIAGKVVYYDADLFADHVDSRGALSRKILSWRERYAVRNADGVISVSKPLARLRERQGAKKVITIPNGVVVDYFLEARQKVAHAPTLIYIGLLSEVWGIDLVLEALPLIKQAVPDVRFIVVGSGDYEDELKRMTLRLGLGDCVKFLGKQPYNQLARHMRQADIGMAIYKMREFVQFASPMKIRDYLAAGLPVITTRIGEAEEIINDSRAGTFVESCPRSIAAAATEILTNRQRAEDYAQAAIQYAPRLDWSTVLEPALDFVVSV